MKSPKYTEDIQSVFHFQNKSTQIFVSNFHAANNLKTLKKLGIKAVITVAKGAFLNHTKEHLPNYLYIPADDNPNYNLSLYFDKTFQFIDKNIQRTNVLVHCVAGISRSVTIVIAYLMKKLHKKFTQVYSQFKKKRKIANPNQGFIQQLKNFELIILQPSKKRLNTLTLEIGRQKQKNVSLEKQKYSNTIKKQSISNQKIRENQINSSTEVIIQQKLDFLKKKIFENGIKTPKTLRALDEFIYTDPQKIKPFPKAQLNKSMNTSLNTTTKSPKKYNNENKTNILKFYASPQKIFI